MTKYYCNRNGCEVVCELNDHIKRSKQSSIEDKPTGCPYDATRKPHWLWEDEPWESG
jgi:hypothetical protein